MSTASASPIVEFRAGKMDWDGKLVTPDKRRGKLALVKDESDLLHVVWTDRDRGTKIDDYVVVQDAYLQRVHKCTTGRVYLLRYTSSKLRLFFWMQEPSAERDAELVAKFNSAIGADIPPSIGAGGDVENSGDGLRRGGAGSVGGAPASSSIPQGDGGGTSSSSAPARTGANAQLQAQLMAMLANAQRPKVGCFFL